MLLLAACGAGTDHTDTNSERITASVPLAAAPDGTGFFDVAADAWYAEAVKWCHATDLMNGTSGSEFSPDAVMTRAMLATVLHRAAGNPAAGEATPFSDVAPDTWYSDPVAWAASNGIVGGYGDGTFGVDDPVTHEQTVTILWRYDDGKAADVEGG